MGDEESIVRGSVSSPAGPARETPRPTNDPGIVVNVARVVGSLVFVAGVLVVIHLLGVVSTYAFGHGNVFGLVPFFNLDLEGNAPTWFSSVLAVVGAALFLLLWRQVLVDGKRSRAWLFLSFIFVYISIDEFTAIHERIILPVREGLDLSGLFYFAWVVPYGLAVAIIAVALAPFLRRLELEARRRFIVAAVVYLSGALGLELIGGRLFESLEGRNLTYDLVVMCEETLEMAGLILLIRAQLLLLGEHHPVTQVSLR